MKLPKSLTNDVIEAIRSSGLDPYIFKYSDNEDEYRIRHPSSGSYFAFRLEGGTFPISYLIAGEVTEQKFDAYIWPKVIDHVNEWATRVKKDLETPDLWAELQREPKLLGVGPDLHIENTPFTPEEKKEITELLQKGGEYVEQTYPLSDSERLEWRAQLAYLTEAVHRLGRRDWRGLLISTLIEFVFYVAPEPAAARDMVFTFLKATGHFFGTHLPELPIQ
jgi:hypothetical protein